MKTMSDNAPINPRDFVTEIQTKHGLKPYLGAHEAIVWFRLENPAPKSQIITVPDFENSLVRAEIYLDGVLVSTAHSKGDGKKSLEKLETGAIRRALANLGYGTIAALASEIDGGSTLTENEQAEVAMASSQLDIETSKQMLSPSGGKRRVNTRKKQNRQDSKVDTRMVEVMAIDRKKGRNGKLFLSINNGECQGFGQRDALEQSGWIDTNELVNEGNRVEFEPPYPVIQVDRNGEYWNMKSVVNVPSIEGVNQKELDIPM
jgi:hypothetical protein